MYYKCYFSSPGFVSLFAIHRVCLSETRLIRLLSVLQTIARVRHKPTVLHILEGHESGVLGECGRFIPVQRSFLNQIYACSPYHGLCA